jgi:hypothetical protein
MNDCGNEAPGHGVGCRLPVLPPGNPLPETMMPKAKNGKNFTDAIALLKADHRKVEELFEEFETAGDARKPDLVKEICTELMVHSMLEEELFYPACKDKIEDEDMLDEAYVEHDGAKVLIAELLEGSAGDEFYDAKVKVLSELIKHHVKEEEQPGEGIFAQAREAGIDLKAMAEDMTARKAQLLAQFAGGDLPPPETRSYTGHKLVQSAPVEMPEAAD